jgi:hypothetical protein
LADLKLKAGKKEKKKDSSKFVLSFFLKERKDISGSTYYIT